jgi:hypothetical protein
MTMPIQTGSITDTQAKSVFQRVAPWLSRLVMSPPIIIFTVISLRYFTNPSRATSGTTLNTPEAFTDTRVIGAWTLTLLIMLITFLVSNRRLWLGHLQLAFFMAATLIVRIFGFVHDGTTLAMGNQRVITIVEIVFLILNSVGIVFQAIWLKDGTSALSQ